MAGLKFQLKHTKHIAWMKIAKSYPIMKRAQREPHYWIEVQNKRIPEFVNYIYNIPFYRKRFEENGVLPQDISKREDFTKLPPLTKQEYREWLLQETADKEKVRYWAHRKTTGSSGTPLELYSLPTDRATEIANLSRCAMIQGKGYNPFFGRIFATMNPQGTGRPTKLSFPYYWRESSISEPKYLVEAYNACKPDFYYGNKTAVQMIAEYALAHQIKLHRAKCVGSISEPLPENVREIINKAFGDNVLFDIYGCAELGNIAVDLPSQPYKHIIWNDTYCVNLQNAEKVEGKDNAYTGKIMVTSLAHRGLPLVNYIIGDTVELTIEDEVPYITKILGRTDDAIRNLDGSKSTWLHVNRIMHGLTDVTQFRCIQKSYTDLLFVLAQTNMSDERKREVERHIQTKAAEFFGTDMDKRGKNIYFQWCERIPPDPTGKIRILISEIKDV